MVALFNTSTDYEQFLGARLITALPHILAMTAGALGRGRELRDRSIGEWLGAAPRWHEALAALAGKLALPFASLSAVAIAAMLVDHRGSRVASGRFARVDAVCAGCVPGAVDCARGFRGGIHAFAAHCAFGYGLHHGAGLRVRWRGFSAGRDAVLRADMGQPAALHALHPRADGAVADGRAGGVFGRHAAVDGCWARACCLPRPPVRWCARPERPTVGVDGDD